MWIPVFWCTRYYCRSNKIGFFLCFLLSSCNSNELTRDKAASIIISYYNLPNRNSNYAFVNKKLNYVTYKHEYDYLLENGIIEFHKNQIPGYTKYIETSVSLTPKGEQYLIEEDDRQFRLRTCETNLGEVTGIRKILDNTAIVEYTFILENITPIGEWKKVDLNRKESRSLGFILYDDGWRMVND